MASPNRGSPSPHKRNDDSVMKTNLDTPSPLDLNDSSTAKIKGGTPSPPRLSNNGTAKNTGSWSTKSNERLKKPEDGVSIAAASTAATSITNAAAAAPESLNIRIRDQRRFELEFRIESTTPLGPILDYFAESLGRDRATLRFFSETVEVTNSSTPSSLWMLDEETIEAFEEEIGGSKDN